ncbi:RHS repeat-associated core domain-containing protein [Candidatus Binatus sp.]|uniref:RHS repeat-associated core domain-containing protein n=1 Tax=Candidatus Binatus sp. TaxID=2811406 RepID=UPI002F9498FC
MTVAGQPQVSYAWDNANRLTGLTQGSTSVSLNYDNANRRTSLTLPNGIVVAYTYDSDSHVKGMAWTLAGNPVGDLEYNYDADGRVIGKTGSFAQTNLPQPVTGNTFNADNEMTAFNGTPLNYDANGNLTDDGTNTYTWDARNQLTAMSGGANASFIYDGFGRRMSKNVAGNTAQFLYDRLNPVQEIQGGTPTANLLTGLRIDERFQRTDPAGTANLLTDILGSTLALTDSTGAIQTQYAYEPFGNGTSIGAASTNSYQYTGRENDGTGLDYYRARYYSPTFQRFIAQDPIGIRSGDLNLYAYVSNSPLNWIDPSGLIINVIGGPVEQGEYNQATSYLSQDPGMNQIIQDLNTSSIIYNIMFNNNSVDSYDSWNHIIQWDPHSGNRCTNKGRQSPALMLGHEMAHADNSLLDQLTGWIPSDQYDNWEEERVITGPESSAADTLGEDTRTDHGGSPYWVPGPTSR